MPVTGRRNLPGLEPVNSKYSLGTRKYSVDVVVSSRQSEDVAECRDGRREEVLSTLGDDPLDGQVEHLALVVRICAHHPARAKTLPVVFLANDGVEAWYYALFRGESRLVCPTCYDA